MPKRQADPITPRKPGRFKSFMVLIAICVAIFFVFRTIAPQTIGEQARRVFEKQLNDHYSDWDISIRRGIFQHGVGLRFEDISLRPKQKETVVGRLADAGIGETLASWIDSPPVTIQSLTVYADIHPEKLLGEGSPMTTRKVIIEGVHAKVDIDPAGQVSLASLWPPPQLGPVCPHIELHSVAVELGAPDELVKPIQVRCRDIAMISSISADPKYSIDKVISIRGDSDLCDGFDIKIRCQQSATHPASVESKSPNTTSVQCSLQQWHIDKSLLTRLEKWLPSHIQKFGIVSPGTNFDFRGDGQLRFSQLTHTGRTVGLDYALDCQVQDGSFTDKRLVGGLSNVTGRIKATPTRLEIDPITANVGGARVTLQATTDLRLTMFGSDQRAVPPPSGFVIPMGNTSLAASIENTEIAVAANDFLIDDRYRHLLPARTALLLDKFRPHGSVDLKSRFHSSSPLNPADSFQKAWQIEADVVCKGVDFQLDKFPYPVKQLTGSIRIADGMVQSGGLAGNAGGQKIHCDFRVPLKLHPDAIVSPEKSILVRTEGSVPIDDALIAALTPREALPHRDTVAAERMAVRPRRLGLGTQVAKSKVIRSQSTLESFVRSLQPRGAVELASALIQTDAGGITSRQFDLRVTGGTMRYEKFAYPLYNVNGRIQVRDELVRIIGFTANNAGAAKIACDGIYEMPMSNSSESSGSSSTSGSDSTSSELNMRFRIADLAMDHSLRVSLPESTRAIWDAISPAGTLDQVDVQVHQHGQMPIDLSLSASQKSAESANPNSLSIRPKALPYRIDIVGGQVKYQDDVVEIKNLRGRHDASRLIADGRCEPDANGRWQLSLDLHSGCRLIPDDELTAALPTQMRDAMRALDLRGPLGLRGRTQIRLPDQVSTDPAIDWDIVLQLEGNRIGDVGPVHSIRGEVEVRGVKDGEILKTAGKVAIDSLHAYGYQVTGIRGPYSIAGDLLRIGTLSSGVDPLADLGAEDNSQAIAVADRVKSQPPLVGNLFGGIVDASGTVALSTGDFDMGVSLSNGKIATVLAELGQTRSGMTGRLDMNSRLEGRLADIDLLKGSGTGRISGANLYELPLIVQTLNLLRITPTEDVAFTDAETQFSLFGENVQFDRLTLWGDLVALDGSGTLSRQEYLDLSFNTRVSPQNLFSKVLSPIRDNSYTFWTIEVNGPLSAPTIQRRALSGVSQTLENWFPGMVRSTTANTSALSR